MSQSKFGSGVAARSIAAIAVQCAVIMLSSVAEAEAANHEPRISGSPDSSVGAEERYVFKPHAYDADRDRLTFSVSNKPAWASFDTSTGRLAGTPGRRAAGTYSDIRIRVSDGRSNDVLGPFSIQVRSANRPPRISGSPPTTAIVGQAYAFKPGASDPEGRPLAFTIVNRPAWASFSGSTGRLAGTPPSGAVGEYTGIRISVSDGTNRTALAPFSIVVSGRNSRPTIAGTPVPEARVGQTYVLQASAWDADGDTLKFSIANRPEWASFDAATGRLSGTPGPAAVGSYENIAIRVTDGIATSSLPTFAIVVQQASNGSATLSWQPPTQREDGSPLVNLAGFRIRYGTQTGHYTNVVEIPNAGITSAVIENLPPATYYFVAAAYDAAGVESRDSAPVSKRIL